MMHQVLLFVQCTIVSKHLWNPIYGQLWLQDVVLEEAKGWVMLTQEMLR